MKLRLLIGSISSLVFQKSQINQNKFLLFDPIEGLSVKKRPEIWIEKSNDLSLGNLTVSKFDSNFLNDSSTKNLAQNLKFGTKNFKSFKNSSKF